LWRSAVPADFQDALSAVAAASAPGALDLAAKWQIARAVSAALGGDAAHPGIWQISYVCVC